MGRLRVLCTLRSTRCLACDKSLRAVSLNYPTETERLDSHQHLECKVSLLQRGVSMAKIRSV